MTGDTLRELIEERSGLLPQQDGGLFEMLKKHLLQQEELHHGSTQPAIFDLEAYLGRRLHEDGGPDILCVQECVNFADLLCCLGRASEALLWLDTAGRGVHSLSTKGYNGKAARFMRTIYRVKAECYAAISDSGRAAYWRQKMRKLQ
jgi:hypothetical protein